MSISYKSDRINLTDVSLDIPSFQGFFELIEESYNRFLNEGLWKAIQSINPITDTLGRMWRVEFLDYEIREPEHTLEEARMYDLTYSYPVYVDVKLTNLQSGKQQRQTVFFGHIPALTREGYFVIHGVIRIVRPQILKAPGIMFEKGKVSPSNPNKYIARLVPQIGTWYSIEMNRKNIVMVSLGRQSRKILFTTLLRALKGYNTAEIKRLFDEVDKWGYIESTLQMDKNRSQEDAVFEIYSKLRPNEMVTYDRAYRFIRSLLFSKTRFNLGEVGRYQLNVKLGLDFKKARLYTKDLVEAVKRLILINRGQFPPEDPFDLSNRRVRMVGELLTDLMVDVMQKFERAVKDRMSRYGASAEGLKPAAFVPSKIITSQIESFLGLNPLSKFLGQNNIFEHIEELRRITAKGRGGLTSDNATAQARDVHYSHFSRLGIASPEGLNAGLISHLAILARVNKYGFIEAPFRRLKREVKNDGKSSLNRILAEDIENNGKVIAQKGTLIDKPLAQKLAKLKDKKTLRVYPFETDKIDYLSYHEETKYWIGVSTYKKDEHGNYLPDLVLLRHNGEYHFGSTEHMDYVDVKPWQVCSVGEALIPFVDRTYSYRAAVGANMQRQALPPVFTEAPSVGTGTEELVARYSRKAIYAPEDGEVTYADANYVIFKGKSGKKYEFTIKNFVQTNDKVAETQKVRVKPRTKVKKGDLLVDGPSMQNGELALGREILAAVMPFEGYNYEDGFAVSERILKEDTFTTVKIHMFTQDLRETLLGPEILTADIPNVNPKLLRNLTREGIVRVGALVEGGDILAGIIAQKADKQLSPEELLLRAVFGELSKEVKNNSLRLPHGMKGIVIRTEVLSREKGHPLPAGVMKRVKVWVAELKRVEVGDKFSGLYGDKGTVAQIFPEEDMPYTRDGRPIDIAISPLLVKRMNMGILPQLMYANLARALGVKLVVPPFAKINKRKLDDLINKVDQVKLYKQELWDGRTGEKLDNVVTVGYKYMLRLKHLASDKMAARSTGPYSVVTMQPVGGKSHMGGQRFGEMEVWVLEAHNAPYTLQEMLTIKSDDVQGRTAAYKSILTGEKIQLRNIPETFYVLLRELNSLGIKVDVKKEKIIDK